VTPPRKQITPADIVEYAARNHRDISAEDVQWGLYFAREFNILESYGASPGLPACGNIPEIPWVIVHERVVTIDADKAWNQHIQRCREVLETNTSRRHTTTAPAAPPQLDENRNAIPTPVPAPRTAENKIKNDWLPEGWRIIESLPEGGQGWTYLVKRTGGQI